VILGKLVEALRPGLYDQLDEATLNAALAIIDSMQPRSELQALLAVQIIATGFAGLRFLRQSHRQMTEDYINVYGGYAINAILPITLCGSGWARRSRRPHRMRPGLQSAARYGSRRRFAGRGRQS